MADATDRPTGITTQAGEVETGGVPSAPAEGTPLSTERPQGYRPVSLLAIISLSVAAAFAILIAADGTVAFAYRSFWVLAVLTVLTPLLAALGAAMAGIRTPARLWSIAGLALLILYAGPVTLGGLVAFPGRVPWLLPGWILIVPLAAGALCWFARNRIQSAEGTLGGLALATWGLWLSFYFGLIYAVYFAGTRLAVEQQAASFVEGYLEHLKKGEVQEAFLLTIEPSRRPTGDPAMVRNTLEMAFNLPGPSGEGAMSEFARREHVRLLEHEGDEATMEQLGFSWTRQAKGYSAEFRYKVNTPTATLTLVVGAIGQDSPEGGRVWQIQRTDIEGAIRYTESGQEFTECIQTAGHFFMNWNKKLREQKWNEAYLDTIPPEKRQRYHDVLRQAFSNLAVTGVGPLAALKDDEKDDDWEVLEGRADFLAGGLFTGLDNPNFWTPPGKRPEVETACREFFTPRGTGFPEVSLTPSTIPRWEREGKIFRLGFNVLFGTPNPEGFGPGYQIQGEAVLQAEAPADTLPRSGWWIERIDLVRAHPPATPKPMGAPGGAPMGAPMGAPGG